MLNYNTYQIRVDENSTVVILNYNPKPSNDLMNEIDDALSDNIKNLYIFIDMGVTDCVVDMNVDLFFRNIIKCVESEMDSFEKIQLIYDSEQFKNKVEKEMISYLLKYLTDESPRFFTTNAGIGENIFKFDYFKRIDETSSTCRKLFLRYIYDDDYKNSFITWIVSYSDSDIGNGSVSNRINKNTIVETKVASNKKFEEKGTDVKEQGVECA